MNPFKHKQLEEFTIEDCELYISKYPYGEHAFEVKRLLRELKKQKAEQPKVKNGEGNPQTEMPRETIKSSNNIPKQRKETSFSKDVTKAIFVWIGIIVVVIVLNEILPYNWWNKYRYIIYAAGLALGRWLQKEFNW